MNKLTALLVDDEENGRSTLRYYLEQHCPEVVVVGEAASVAEAVEEIRTSHPRLVFLDINMPGKNGFALFEYFPQPEFYTIFVTAYDSYALQAIKQHALDYLLKPLNIAELIAAVQHAVAKAIEPQPGANAGFVREEQLGQLLKDLCIDKSPDKVALALLDGLLYVQPSDIIRCEANGNYTNFHFVNRPPLLTSRALGYYEALLDPYRFIRVHHKHLINPAHVERYQRGRTGKVIMSDKSEVSLSYQRKDDFLVMMNGQRA